MAYFARVRTRRSAKTTPTSPRGIITEIGADYIKIDDSVMMADPDDGVVFTVKANSLHIRRYIDCGYLRVGGSVMIEYGATDPTDPFTISTATRLETVIISDSGDVLIPE